MHWYEHGINTIMSYNVNITNNLQVANITANNIVTNQNFSSQAYATNDILIENENLCELSNKKYHYYFLEIVR